MGTRSRLLVWLVACAWLGAPAACLRGSQSEACEILEDCLCGEFVGTDRGRCLEGDNRIGLNVGVERPPLSEEQCTVVLHQQGDACPHGDLAVVLPDPDPRRRCVHANDCETSECDCDGTASVAARVGTCVGGFCVDAVEECSARCLAARLVRGDPCEMLGRCRCAPLLPEPFLDADGNGEPDLTECLSRLPTSSDEVCRQAARESEPAFGGQDLPSRACPDAAEFVSDP